MNIKKEDLIIFHSSFLNNLGFFSSEFLVVTCTEMGTLVGSDNEDEAMLPFKHGLKFSKSKNLPNIQKHI